MNGFEHTNISFGEVIVKRDIEITHEGKILLAMSLQGYELLFASLDLFYVGLQSKRIKNL